MNRTFVYRLGLSGVFITISAASIRSHAAVLPAALPTNNSINKCDKIYDIKGIKLDYSSSPLTKKDLSFRNVKSNQQFADQLKLNKMNAAWELSRIGLANLRSSMHRMDNVIYYLSVAMMAKEHVLMDGDGGGGKTFVSRKFLEAQLLTVNKWSTQKFDKKMQQLSVEQNEEIKDIEQFMKELRLITENLDVLPDDIKQIFMKQFHRMDNETPIHGGPDPFKFVEDGEYKIDYSRALIAKRFFFAILDEIEKAPVDVQMTLLSVLNERQALVGNQIVQTMIESVVATTNATLGGLMAQAKPHEVGGRQAFIDRMGLKVHVVNKGTDEYDMMLFVEKLEKANQENKFIIIDLRSLRPLMDKIHVTDKTLKSAINVTTAIDALYTKEYNDAIEAVRGYESVPTFFPPFLGSNRSQMKIPKMWKAAFLMKQLLRQVPFDNRRMTLEEEDLMELAPALLQGGPEGFVFGKGYRVLFTRFDANGLDGSIVERVAGNRGKAEDLGGYPIKFKHEGFYDPRTQTFSYLDKNRYIQEMHFDAKRNKLIFPNKEVAIELGLTATDEVFKVESRLAKGKYITPLQSFEENLSLIQKGWEKNKERINSDANNSKVEYEVSPYLQAILDSGRHSTEAENQITEIQKFHNKFLTIVKETIRANRSNPAPGRMLPKQHPKTAVFKNLEDQATNLATKLKQALTRNDKEAVQYYSILGIRLFFTELSTKMVGNDAIIRAVLLNVLSGKNAMLQGPPGSAKSLLSRLILESALTMYNEAVIAKANAILSEALLKENSKKELYIKQFHPMSDQGDIIGRIDLAQVRAGHGYKYNRTGSLAANDVLFALLDEFEKAPAGTKTAGLSLMNERQVFAGDELVVSMIHSIILTTNATPSQFMQGYNEEGGFSTAFPIWDRIHQKIYVYNKSNLEQLYDMFLLAWYNLPIKVKSPLFPHGVLGIADKINISTVYGFKNLLVGINSDFDIATMKRHKIEKGLHQTNPKTFPDYYMPTRGNSYRTVGSIFVSQGPGKASEAAYAVLLNRILADKDPRYLVTSSEIIIDLDRLDDLIAIAKLELTENQMFELKYRINSNGMPEFFIEEKSIPDDRLQSAERRVKNDYKFEYEEMAKILNLRVDGYLRGLRDLILSHRDLFPSLFASVEQRKAYLRTMGFSDEQINAHNP